MTGVQTCALPILCGLLKDISNNYSKKLLPIFKDNNDIFNPDLSRFSFPIPKSTSNEFIMQWLSVCKEFIEILSDELKKISSNPNLSSITKTKERELNKEIMMYKDKNSKLGKELETISLEYKFF